MINLGNDQTTLEYKGIVLSIAGKYTNGQDFEDLVQAGMEGMYYAISTYDKTKNTKLSSYIYMWVRNKIQIEKNSQNLITMSVPTSRKTKITINSLDYLPEQNDDQTALDNMIADEDEFMKAKRYTQILSVLNKKISAYDRCIVIDSLIYGLSIAKLNKKYGRCCYGIVRSAVDLIKSTIMPPQSSSSFSSNSSYF